MKQKDSLTRLQHPETSESMKMHYYGGSDLFRIGGIGINEGNVRKGAR